MSTGRGGDGARRERARSPRRPRHYPAPRAQHGACLTELPVTTNLSLSLSLARSLSLSLSFSRSLALSLTHYLSRSLCSSLGVNERSFSHGKLDIRLPSYIRKSLLLCLAMVQVSNSNALSSAAHQSVDGSIAAPHGQAGFAGVLPGVGTREGVCKVDIRLPGNREFKLPWHKAVLLQSSR